jgi:hypothetical protein
VILHFVPSLDTSPVLIAPPKPIYFNPQPDIKFEGENDMGMSTRVEGFRPPDGDWVKMKKVWDACENADIAPPPEVQDYFENRPPDPTGVVVDISEAVSEYNAEMQDGYEVDLSKLAKDVKVIRFVNSY